MPRSDENDTPRVIDLTNGATAVVRVERDGDPFARLSTEARVRLIVRVLCGLVAYGEAGGPDTDPTILTEPIAS